MGSQTDRRDREREGGKIERKKERERAKDRTRARDRDFRSRVSELLSRLVVSTKENHECLRHVSILYIFLRVFNEERRLQLSSQVASFTGASLSLHMTK